MLLEGVGTLEGGCLSDLHEPRRGKEEEEEVGIDRQLGSFGALMGTRMLA